MSPAIATNRRHRERQIISVTTLEILSPVDREATREHSLEVQNTVFQRFQVTLFRASDTALRHLT
jgi:hypothetical protein